MSLPRLRFTNISLISSRMARILSAGREAVYVARVGCQQGSDDVPDSYRVIARFLYNWV
jgi:hypothetical protein